MPGIPTFTSTSYLSLPPTTAAFWQYVSSPLLSHSLQTVLSASTTPTTRFTISSIITSFAQFQHVIGSIMSSSDPAAAEYFEWFLLEQLNLSPEKIDERWTMLREAMKTSLSGLVEASLKTNRRQNCIMHPAVLEAREILTEMRLDESEEGNVRVYTSRHKPSTSKATGGKKIPFLDVEEYTLRSEFMAFRRDTPGPNGRCSAPTPRPVCPSLIMSLRIYHDGLLSVDSKHAFQPGMSRPPSSRWPQSQQLDSLQQQLRNKRFPTTNLEHRGSSISFLERQFLEAMQIMPVRHRANIEHDIELTRLLEAYTPNFDPDSDSGLSEKDNISISVSPKSRSGSVVSNIGLQHRPQTPVEFPSQKETTIIFKDYVIQQRRESGAESDRSEASTIGKVVRKNSQYTWKGDWETEAEEEFYREALKYNPSR